MITNPGLNSMTMFLLYILLLSIVLVVNTDALTCQSMDCSKFKCYGIEPVCRGMIS